MGRSSNKADLKRERRVAALRGSWGSCWSFPAGHGAGKASDPASWCSQSCSCSSAQRSAPRWAQIMCFLRVLEKQNAFQSRHWKPNLDTKALEGSPHPNHAGEQLLHAALTPATSCYRVWNPRGEPCPWNRAQHLPSPSGQCLSSAKCLWKSSKAFPLLTITLMGFCKARKTRNPNGKAKHITPHLRVVTKPLGKAGCWARYAQLK